MYAPLQVAEQGRLVVLDQSVNACESAALARLPTCGQMNKSTARKRLQQLATTHEDYLHGQCATLAIAMHKLAKLPIYAILGFDESIQKLVLIHAYVKAGDIRIDIKGPRSFEAVALDFQDDDAFFDSYETEISVQRVAKLATGSRACPTLDEAMPVAEEILALTSVLMA